MQIQTGSIVLSPSLAFRVGASIVAAKIKTGLGERYPVLRTQVALVIVVMIADVFVNSEDKNNKKRLACAINNL